METIGIGLPSLNYVRIARGLAEIISASIVKYEAGYHATNCLKHPIFNIVSEDSHGG